jgi:hypothetical protein
MVFSKMTVGASVKLACVAAAIAMYSEALHFKTANSSNKLISTKTGAILKRVARDLTREQKKAIVDEKQKQVDLIQAESTSNLKKPLILLARGSEDDRAETPI